ncbi:MAG: extracellular solute-binding protein [Blautia marasmi]
MWTRDSTVAAVKSAAEKYNKQNDKVEIKVVEQPASQMADQLSLALSSDEAPDIVSLDCTKVPYFASIGAFADISDKYEALDYKDTFSEGMIKSGQLEGKTYAVPFAPDVSVLLYNKDHYQEAGLDPETPPKTWDELIAYSQKLTTSDRYGYVYAEVTQEDICLRSCPMYGITAVRYYLRTERHVNWIRKMRLQPSPCSTI